MKALILLTVIFTMAQFASADIPLPHNPNSQSEVRSQTYSGPRAEAKWNSIKVTVGSNSSGWSGETVAYKVERSSDGLKQTVCTATGNFRTKATEVYSCTVQQSLDGKPLPKFVFHKHMG